MSHKFFRAAAVALLISSMSGAFSASINGAPATSRDIRADTWGAVDALGRVLPNAAVVGAPRADRTVGMFYFLTFDPGGAGPWDNTQILKAHPEAIQSVTDPAWGPLNQSHYWGKPLFGYYSSDDDFVLRKHAEMLSNAGVDVVIFDNSNAVTYDRAREELCRVWEQIRKEGGKTPQIAFLCPFGNPDNIGNRTLLHLYKQIYEPKRYQDLWFRWRGKPLVMAYPAYADAFTSSAQRVPVALNSATPLGQSFTAIRPFTAVGGEFPTWGSKVSGMRLTLTQGSRVIATHKFANVPDNAPISLQFANPLPPGVYTLTQSDPVGQIGWWSYDDYVYSGGSALEFKTPIAGDRSLHVRFTGDSTDTVLSPGAPSSTTDDSQTNSKAMHAFFAFRPPIAPYNIQHPVPGQWAWLQIFPQAVQTSTEGVPEQITVGVAQNYNATVNNTAPMSVPGAFGRSYHGGAEDTRPGAVNWGYNFEEQWQRARAADPPFVFVTGWNEWTAGFYDSWVSWHAPPPVFVDEFTEEFSRDIEPMSGGHSDNYYMQLVSNIRKYKGVRTLPPLAPAAVKMDGNFAEWAKVAPDYLDNDFDEVHRNAVGSGSAGWYVNHSGRNDIELAKVSYDSKFVYFYVRTRRPLTNPRGGDWMQLYIDSDSNAKTGWLGYDFVVNHGTVSAGRTTLDRAVGTSYRWKKVMPLTCRWKGREFEVAVPLSAMHMVLSHGKHFSFKWADHCYHSGTAEDFSLYGDAAPDDRFSYVAWVR